MHWSTRGLRRPIVGALAGVIVFSGALAGSSQADPSADALAKLNELSRQAEQTTEAMHSAELDLTNKVAAQQAADQKHAADVAAVDTSKAQLATFQTSVDKIAAAQYMGGRTDGLDAMLTAGSPQGLIDQLAVQRVMATEMSVQMQNFKSGSVLATQAEV
ncbi:MAG: endopeptidase, partial [Actinomycetota bacterium]|nr:endopeptidase [Actinomycetota bacterium]